MAKQAKRGKHDFPSKRESQPGSVSSSHIRSREMLPGILIFLVSFLIYLPVLKNGFVQWDDGTYVYENPHIRSLGLDTLFWMFTSFSYANNWHPLTWLSHALDIAFWGLNPLMHHLTNILLHALNTLLVFFLTFRLVERVGTQKEKQAETAFPFPSPMIVGVVAALLFGLHPLHVESVAWASERKDLLCAFFFLLALLFYLRFTLPDQAKKLSCYLTMIIFFILALLSKPMAVTFPVVLLIMDVYPLGRLRIGSRRLLSILGEKIPLLALSLISSIATMKAQSAGMAPIEDVVPMFRIFNAVRSLGFYLLKALFPFSLSPYYPLPFNPHPGDPEYLVSGIAVLCITLFCFRMLRRKQYLWICAWAYYIVTLLPVIGLIQVGIQSAADRYMYLPSLSLFMLCGLGVSYFWSQTASGRFGKKMRPLLLLSLGFLFLSLSAITVQQISVWKSGFALWSYVIRVFPDTAFFAYDNLGSFFEHEGKLDQAIPYYKKALSINPYYRQARNNLGKAYAQMNLYDQAIFEFKEAIRMSPSFEIAYINLGHLYLQRGELDEAIGQFQKALEIKPDYAEAYFQLGSAYSQKGKLDQGISAFQNAILYNKDYADAYFNMGVVYTYQKKMDLAIASFEKAVSLDPSNAAAMYYLSQSHYSSHNIQAAVHFMEKARALGYPIPEDYRATLESAAQPRPAK